MRLHNSQPTAKCVTTNRIELQSVSYAGICGHVNGLRGLPSEGLQRHHKPGACGCTIPNRLQKVSQRSGLEDGDVRPQHEHYFPAQRRTYRIELYSFPLTGISRDCQRLRALLSEG